MNSETFKKQAEDFSKQAKDYNDQVEIFTRKRDEVSGAAQYASILYQQALKAEQEAQNANKADKQPTSEQETT